MNTKVSLYTRDSGGYRKTDPRGIYPADSTTFVLRYVGDDMKRVWETLPEQLCFGHLAAVVRVVCPVIHHHVESGFFIFHGIIFSDLIRIEYPIATGSSSLTITEGKRGSRQKKRDFWLCLPSTHKSRLE